MRFAIVFTLVAAVSTSASFVARQSLPPCYLNCSGQALAEVNGNCDASNSKCLCSDPNFVKKATDCVEATCQGADLQAALNAGNSACLAVGVTLSASSTAASSASAGSSSASASAPANTSSAAASVHGVNALIGLAAFGLVTIILL